MMRRRADLPPVEPQPWAALIPPESFYARLAAYRDVLVTDDECARLYKASRESPWPVAVPMDGLVLYRSRRS